MTAEIQTVSKALASAIANRNLGSSCIESAGVWTVSHPSELVIPSSLAQKFGGYEVSYPESRGPLTFSDTGSSTIADIVTQGYRFVWTAFRLTIRSGSEADASYIPSLQPQWGPGVESKLGEKGDDAYSDEVRLARARGGAIAH